MTAHAAASPSSADMWMHCPASITLSNGRTRPSSRYAKEGTAAHTIAELILGGELFPPGKIDIEGDQFIVGLPMLRALNNYIDTIEILRSLGAEVFIEQRVTLPLSGGWVWGTADCASRLDEALRIDDLKYGKGVPVAPSGAQLKIYALASAATLWPNVRFKEVHLTVHQPRLDPQPKSETLSFDALNDWKKAELMPAIGRLMVGDTSEVPGRWCRWCVRRGECVAFASHKNSTAADIFDDGLDTLSY